MIDLSWNTRGRLSRRAYRRLRWTLGAIPALAMVALIAAFTFGLQPFSILGEAAITIVLLAIAYTSYRHLQATLRRLHDRNLSGNLIWPWFLIAVFGVSLAATVLSNDGRMAGWAAWLEVPNNHWILLAVIVPFALYGLYVGINLHMDGTNGPNRYGPPPPEGK